MDNFFNSALMLGILAYIGNALRDIPSSIYSFIMQRIRTRIEFWYDTGYRINYSIEWLHLVLKNNKFLKTQRMYSSTDTIVNIFPNGNYWIYLGKYTFMNINKSTSNKNVSNGFQYIFTLDFIGLNRNKYLKWYDQYINESKPSKDEYLSITIPDDRGYNSDARFILKKSFDAVFTPYKDDIISVLDQFISNKSIFMKYGITHSIGILLYGPPGTGKSTIARAISTYLDKPITYMNYNGIYHLENIDNDQNTVYLFEDIDCILEGGKRKKDKTKEKHGQDDGEENVYSSKIILHKLLNFIDGPLTPSNCIFIATTNCIDKLDPALLRKGRFDYTYFIDFMTKDEAKSMCDAYNLSYDELNDVEFPCSPAVIQEKMIDYYSNRKKK